MRKAFGLAAEIFDLDQRSYLRPGEWADIVIFDPAVIADRADYDQSFAEPASLNPVIVNGVVTLAHGAFTNQPPAGQALRRTAASGANELAGAPFSSGAGHTAAPALAR